ncbi:MAG: glycosyltransferase [Flavobacteriales bacterium]|nr:glycosyltransferase [Flavobacteriales bacterium]
MSMLEGGLRTQGKGPTGTAERPLVSIVTVVFNGAASVERTIESVLAQTWPNIEYIVVDGGSTDGTVDILERYGDRIAYWRSEKDNGIYDAMNKGVSLCTGSWVGLINADDWYGPRTVERAMDAAASSPGTNIVHGDIWLHYPNGHSTLKRAKVSGFLLKYWEMVLNHPSFFVRRSYYDGRPFDASLKVSADHKWTYEAYRDEPSQFTYVPEPLAHFSVGGASMSVPLNKVLREGRRVSRDLGMGPFQTFVGTMVRAIMYPLQHMKLRFNQHVSPLIRKTK